MVQAAVVNIFDQSMRILLVLYAIHLPQTDAGLQLCPRCPQAQWGRCNLGIHWRISMQFRVIRYFVTKPDCTKE